MDPSLLAMLQTADQAIIPRTAIDWWGWVVRNWIPLAAMAAFVWKVAMRDQNHKHEEAKRSCRELSTKIGLPEGYTVKSTIDGLSIAVEEKLDRLRGDFTQFRTETLESKAEREARLRKVEGDVRDQQGALTNINKELGRMSSLFEQGIAEQSRGRELIMGKLNTIEINQARQEERSNFVPVLEKLMNRLEHNSNQKG